MSILSKAFVALLLLCGPALADGISNPGSSGSSSITAGTTPCTSCTPGGVLYNSSGVVSTDSGLTYNDVNKALTVGGATVTTSNPVLNLSQTWNAGGVTFTGETSVFTDTASAALSRVRTWFVGANEIAGIVKDGSVYGSLGFWQSAARSFNGANYWGMAYTNSFIDFYAPAFATDGKAAFSIGRGVGVGAQVATCLGISSLNSASLPDTGLCRNAAGVVEFNNGTAGTFRDILARVIQSSGVTFATLTTGAGKVAYITDGLAANCGDTTCTTWGTAVTAGGGALKLLVWYNNAGWTLIGK